MCVCGEICGIVPPKVAKCRFQEMIKLVLVSQTDAGRNSLVRGAGVRRKWSTHSLVHSARPGRQRIRT